MKNSKKFKNGFTLIELLIVIAIIGLLASVSLIFYPEAIKKAWDARRLQDVGQTVSALAIYKANEGQYPDISSDSCCGIWDQGPCEDDDTFIRELIDGGVTAVVPVDPKGGSGTGCYGYEYHRYNCTDGGSGYPCYGCTKPFFVLGIVNMESTGRPYPDSPGWSCPNRNWQTEFDWVTGGFEK